MRFRSAINRWTAHLEWGLSTITRTALACLALVALSPDLLSVLADWAGGQVGWTEHGASGICVLQLVISNLGGPTP